jgi:hypothetical protein
VPRTRQRTRSDHCPDRYPALMTEPASSPGAPSPGASGHDSIPPTIRAARDSVRAALLDLREIDDDSLENPWRWRPDDPRDADVRYAFYRAYEMLQDAAVTIGRGRAMAGDDQPGPAVPVIAAASAARWDLHGLIHGLREEQLDAEPGGNEWTVRRTLGHIIGGQRMYGWSTGWWLERCRAGGSVPDRIPEEEWPLLPREEDEAAGSSLAILARLDGLLDADAARFAGLDEGELSCPARWAGLPVDVAFRLGRWDSHIREHTIQVEKTMVMTGTHPTEAGRIVRLVAASWGRLEAMVYGRPETALDRPLVAGRSAADEIMAVAGAIREMARTVRQAEG